MSIVADQRKRNTNQSRPNVASQQNSSSTIPQQKKGNKQNHQQNSAKASSPAPTSKPPSPPVPRPEKHVSLLGYNGDEIDNLLSKGIPADANAYKPENPAAQKTGPWGQKPGTMASGKDFWFELRKQVATLQKGESTNKGG